MIADSDITERISRGDVDAFSALFRSTYEQLCYFAQRFVDDFDAAEGIVQDVFVRLWDSRPSLAIHTSLRSYLYAAVRNACLNHLKHGRFSTQLDEVEDHSDETDLLPDAQLEASETADAVNAAIDALPPKCREIFRLARFDGLSYQEIAEIQGVSVNTVKTQLQRGLKSLARALHYLQVLLVLLNIARPLQGRYQAVTRCDDSIVMGVEERSRKVLS